MYDVIIIGAGVAGMTAAIYAARAGKKVLVFESGVAGGQIVQAHDVRNWPGERSISGEKLTKEIFEQAKALGAEFEFAEVRGVISPLDNESRGLKANEGDGQVFSPLDDKSRGLDATKTEETKQGFKVETDDGEYAARAVIIATGSHDRPLGLPEEAKYLGHGLSYCVTCDGALYKDKDVAVVGGGNTAFYDVMYLANIVRRVYLIHRREEFRADATLVEKVRKLKNVQIWTHWTVEGLEGEKELEKVRVRLNLGEGEGEEVENGSVMLDGGKSEDMKNSGSGKIEEVRKSGSGEGEAKNGGSGKNEEMEIEVAGLFVAIGREPATAAFRGLVEMDDAGYVIADENGVTSREGVFVAGDCRTKKVRQLVTAAADGATAASAAVEFLNQ